MNYSPIFSNVQTDRQMERQMESDTYEPTVQCAWAGSKMPRVAIYALGQLLKCWVG